MVLYPEVSSQVKLPTSPSLYQIYAHLNRPHIYAVRYTCLYKCFYIPPHKTNANLSSDYVRGEVFIIQTEN